MTKQKNSFMNIIDDIYAQLKNIILENTASFVNEGANILAKIIEKKIMRIQKKLQKKITSFSLILLSGLFFILALLFFLIEYLMWSKTIAFFTTGIITLIIGLMIK